MSQRRPHPEQPDNFAFTEANLAWAYERIAMYPEGRQASAVIPLLWRAQEQEGWLSVAAMEVVAGMLDMAPIRVMEVATFYTMFHLAPVGRHAHVQCCGTTPCMLRGAEDLVAACRESIGPEPGVPYHDGAVSWEEVECLGACSNAPVVQIGPDYYEDLTPEALRRMVAEFRQGGRPRPGSAIGRFSSEPRDGAKTLKETSRASDANASVALALEERGRRRHERTGRL